MMKNTWKFALLGVALLGGTRTLRAQAPVGPIAPKPGQPVQQAPPDAQAKLKFGVSLVNMPVTVRNDRGGMVHNLEASDFRITDNGIEQKIAHFDLGGDPVSVVILIETSSRIASLVPALRKTGILFTQTVMGPTAKARSWASTMRLTSCRTSPRTPMPSRTPFRSCKRELRDRGCTTRWRSASRCSATGRSRPLEKPGRRRVLLVMSEADGHRQRNEAGRSAAKGAARECDDLHRWTFNHARGIARPAIRERTRRRSRRREFPPCRRLRERRRRQRSKPLRKVAEWICWRWPSGPCSTSTASERPSAGSGDRGHGRRVHVYV